MCLSPVLLINPTAKRLWDFRTCAYFNGSHNKLEGLSFNQYTALCGIYEDGTKITDPEKIDHVVSNCYISVSGTRVNCFISANCGRCSHCKDSRRREYQARALFEASDSEHLVFFTLTYSNRFLPESGLFKPHMQQFLKLFRETLAFKYSKLYDVSLSDARKATSFRCFYCGEYGVDPRYTRRPHYHGLLFFEHRLSHKAFLFVRRVFRKCWKYGKRYDFQSVYNPVASAKYICKYITKQDIQDVPEGKTPCFIQGPTQRGLGSFKLENHIDDILCSTDGCVYLRIGGRPVKTKIPSFLLSKIFPTFSRSFRTDSKRLFGAHLIDIFFDLDMIRSELLLRKDTDPFCPFDVSEHDYILHSFDWIRQGFNKLCSVDYERLVIRGFDPVSYFSSFSIEELRDSYLHALYWLLDFLPSPDDFQKLFFPKLQWQSNLNLPSLSYRERLQLNDNIMLNNLNYVRDRMLGDEHCLYLHHS